MRSPDAPSPHRDADWVDRLLVVLIIGALVLVVASMFGAGVSTSVAGVRISVRTLLRPLVVAALLTLIAAWRSPRRERQLTQLWNTALSHGTSVAIVIAVFVFAIAMRTSLFEARASDQYGYVSQAALWANGTVVIHEPLAATAPWPNATWTVAPLGYRPGREPATIVPTYPPGLPLIMAVFIRLFGPFGAFLVVPLLGSLAVIATFFLGRQTAGVACGLFAAMALATSPIFLFQLREPMSDVPVTAWWLIATLLVTAPYSGAALAGGFAALAAIVTRPNLIPLAAVLVVYILTRASMPIGIRLRNAALFSAGTLSACVALAILNRSLYGSPFESGYGSTAELFKLQYLTANLATYPRWLIETETPIIIFALLAPWFVSPSLSRLFLAISATLFASYAFYVPFDNWTYLRFWLPAIALLLILTSGVVLQLSLRLRSPLSRWAVAALCLAVMGWRWDSAGMQPPQPNDRRFAVVGEFVRNELPPNAILLSMQHSGSVRYYSGRPTVRWDLLPEEWLDGSVRFLRENGYVPLLLLEEWEQPLFVQRFAPHSKLGALDRQPLATYTGQTRADIFDLSDQANTSSTEPSRKIVSAPPSAAR